MKSGSERRKLKRIKAERDFRFDMLWYAAKAEAKAEREAKKESLEYRILKGYQETIQGIASNVSKSRKRHFPVKVRETENLFPVIPGVMSEAEIRQVCLVERLAFEKGIRNDKELYNGSSLALIPLSAITKRK